MAISVAEVEEESLVVETKIPCLLGPILSKMVVVEMVGTTRIDLLLILRPVVDKLDAIATR